MSLDLLKQNIAREKEIVESLIASADKLDNLPKESEERAALEKSMSPKLSQLRILNNAVPALLDNIPFYKPLGNKIPEQKITAVSYTDQQKGERKTAAVKKTEEKQFMEKLSVSQYSDKKPLISEETSFTFYARISNKLFKAFADNLVEKGYFDGIKTDLRRITSPIIISSYISMMLFSTLLSFFFGIILGTAVFLTAKNIGLAMLLVALLPVIVFVFFLTYPSSQRKNLEKEINNELPFLTIYMGAIATSGIEPSKIFDILVASKDYPFSQREMKKLTNYINFYGYDLVSALRAVGKNGPSDKLSQLFDGLATAITSGGELTSFLSKHAETLLFDYRLEREKYTHVAETFMNIYISVVIAAPMILMILFILMSVSGFGAGFLTAGRLGILTILVVGLLNIGFLVFLNMKQPKF